MPRKLIYKTPKGFAKCIDNDIEQDADGGRVTITAQDQFQIPGSKESMYDDQKLLAASVVLNFRKDEPMEVFPRTREEKARRRFTVEIYEEEPLELVKSSSTKKE